MVRYCKRTYSVLMPTLEGVSSVSDIHLIPKGIKR